MQRAAPVKGGINCLTNPEDSGQRKMLEKHALFSSNTGPSLFNFGSERDKRRISLANAGTLEYTYSCNASSSQPVTTRKATKTLNGSHKVSIFPIPKEATSGTF
jgi:hypothetical protein